MNVAFIPSRIPPGDSKGMPGKNGTKLLFCGKPLVQWAIECAKETKLFDKIVVSSNDADVLGLARKMGCIADRRPDELCQSESIIDDAMIEYFSRTPTAYDYICLLQPTSPLRSVKDVVGSYRAVQRKKWHSVVTVQWNPVMAWVKEPSKAGSICLYQIHKRPNRQTRDNFFLENGAVYWMKYRAFMTTGNRIIDPLRCFVYEMPAERSLEVDNPYDWFLAEKTYEWLNGGRK
jgi:CMP-N-acetylneuraminic acid synthetase